tara:strand:+ start:50 stop:256 length:207 start_codon:yes stop_codon:yes gene_type:complete
METKQSNLSEYGFNIEQYGEENREIVIRYIESLTDLECKAMKIAEDHLETSFHIMKSIGFQKWLKNNM